MLVITVLLATILLVITAFLFVFYREYRKTRRLLREFTVPAGPDEPTPLFSFIDAASQQFSRSLVALAKSQLMGSASAAVRAEKAIEGDLAEDTMNMTNPLIGQLIQQFPTLRKTLRRNPALVNMAVSKLMGMGKKNNGPSGAPSNQAEFNL